MEKPQNINYVENERSWGKTEYNLGLAVSSSTYMEYFGLVEFKVIWGSFGALTIFRNLGIKVRHRTKTF